MLHEDLQEHSSDPFTSLSQHHCDDLTFTVPCLLIGWMHDGHAGVQLVFLVHSHR